MGMGKYSKNKWVEAIVSALVAFLTALSVSSCTGMLV